MNRRQFLFTSLCAPLALTSINSLGSIIDTPIVKAAPWYAPAGVMRVIRWIPCVQSTDQLINIPDTDKQDVIGCFVEDHAVAYIRIPYQQKYLFRTLTHTKWVQFTYPSI